MKPLSESEARFLAGLGKLVTIPRTKAGKEAARKLKEEERKHFLKLCEWNCLPEPVPEYHFRIAGHRNPFRFDWAWPVGSQGGVVVEIEGGSFQGHGHRSIGKYLSDQTKYNEATIAGWRIIRVTTTQVKSGEVFNLVRRALGL